MGVWQTKNDQQIPQGAVNNYNLNQQNYWEEMIKNSYPAARIVGMAPFYQADDQIYDSTGVSGAVNLLAGTVTFFPVSPNIFTIKAIRPDYTQVSMVYDASVAGASLQPQTLRGVWSYIDPSTQGWQFVGFKVTIILPS